MTVTINKTVAEVTVTAPNTATINISGANTATINENQAIVTSNLTSTDTISSPAWIQFNTTATSTPGIGRVMWNDTDGTLEWQLKGGNVTLQVGQEQVVRVRNTDSVTFTDGMAVYISGSTGSRPAALRAQANTETSSAQLIGIATETFAKNTEGYVTTFGMVHDLDTSAMTEGAIVWLSDTVSGGLTTTPPVSPSHLVQIGFCVRSHPNLGVIFVRVQNGYELNELHDVKITNPTNGQYLRYQSSTGLWVNSN